MSELVRTIDAILKNQLGVETTQTQVEIHDGKKGRFYDHRIIAIQPTVGISAHTVSEVLARENIPPMFLQPKATEETFTTLRTFEALGDRAYNTISIQIYPSPAEEVAVQL